uniref:Uncharacterized protein n=1 Tax=Meloidogyne enterolobii TaxID=390850 RepID=A0A6V7X792_MELEN|nr:unnamed protein product [Meloidogyne enterolobii]
MHLFLYFTLFFISASTSFDEPPVFFLVGSWLILVIIVLVAFGFVITPLALSNQPTALRPRLNILLHFRALLTGLLCLYFFPSVLSIQLFWVLLCILLCALIAIYVVMCP